MNRSSIRLLCLSLLAAFVSVASASATNPFVGRWALTLPGVDPMILGARRMRGYVRAAPEAYTHDEHRRRLIEAAVAFTRTLPKK